MLGSTGSDVARKLEPRWSRSWLRHLFVEEMQVPFRRHRVWRKLETAVLLATA